METSIKCKCGCNEFWYFGEYVRCSECFSEYKTVDNQDYGGELELWTRTFDELKHQFGEWFKTNQSM